jgi:hypothetical protein
MNTVTASDEVTDAIAHIEMERQEMEKTSGRAASCDAALRKLHELLDQEKAAPEPHGAGSGYLANTEAVMIEIKRVKQLASGKNQGAAPRNQNPRHHQMSFKSGSRNPARNKGRRTMGRRGER